MGSVEEAIQWMKYTYLWVRMQKNPLLYGINQKMRERDPDLHHVSLFMGIYFSYRAFLEISQNVLGTLNFVLKCI